MDAAVQAAEALRTASLARAPVVCDLRRFGDRWQKDANCPDEAPLIDDGPSGLVERVHRWSRALADPFTRWLIGGSVLAPVIHDAAILTWWRRVVADADHGTLKPGRPATVRLTRIAPVPAFSDDEEATPPNRLATPAPRVLSAPAASTPSAAGAPRGAAVPPVPGPAPRPAGVEIGPPGKRTFLGRDYEIRERVPEPIDPAKVEAALRGEHVLMSQREFEAFQAAKQFAEAKATGRPATLSEYEQAAYAEFEKARATASAPGPM